MSQHSHEDRVRLKAYEIWLNEGKPEGREQRHWEMARETIGYEDARRSTLEPSFGDAGAQQQQESPRPAKAAPAKAAAAKTEAGKKVA
ncbi:DUF2934 domain-containing protein [Labrys wisconsinensis]|uniref:DUF2934 domain-containing protein n=1 Tax=Labrys wisconsinensis TaxID=425677 RepID=A0ABU0J9F6_9HYPH|nr:DUF2934 domain-containing protein [Labrys wisconsinensis]MDQ0470900.1 hypothetical protein [Labrys wisconsinensis]